MRNIKGYHAVTVKRGGKKVGGFHLPNRGKMTLKRFRKGKK